MNYHEFLVVAQKYTEIDLANIDSKARLKEDLRFSSFHMLMLIYDLQMNFGIEIDFSAMKCVRTVADFLRVLGAEGCCVGI